MQAGSWVWDQLTEFGQTLSIPGTCTSIAAEPDAGGSGSSCRSPEGTVTQEGCSCPLSIGEVSFSYQDTLWCRGRKGGVTKRGALSRQVLLEEHDGGSGKLGGIYFEREKASNDAGSPQGLCQQQSWQAWGGPRHRQAL